MYFSFYSCNFRDEEDQEQRWPVDYEYQQKFGDYNDYVAEDNTTSSPIKTALTALENVTALREISTKNSQDIETTVSSATSTTAEKQTFTIELNFKTTKLSTTTSPRSLSQTHKISFVDSEHITKSCKGRGFWNFFMTSLSDWCNKNCNHTPPYCPDSHCICD